MPQTKSSLDSMAWRSLAGRRRIVPRGGQQCEVDSCCSGEIPGRRMRSWRDSRAQALFASNITRSALSNFILQKFWLHDGSFERRQTSRGHGGEATQRDRTDGLRKCVGCAVGEFLHAEDRLVLTLGNRPGRLDRQGFQAQAQWAMMFSQRPDHGVR